MASIDTNTKERPSDIYIFSDQDSDPLKTDINPAHFEGFLLELAESCERSGKFLDFQQQGIVLSGHRIVVDTVAAVPFVQGLYGDAPKYSAGDACPPTAQRLAAYDAARARNGLAAVTPITAMPGGVTNIVVNPYLIKQQDLAFGDSIAACFAPDHSAWINTLRGRVGMGGARLRPVRRGLGGRAPPAGGGGDEDGAVGVAALGRALDGGGAGFLHRVVAPAAGRVRRARVRSPPPRPRGLHWRAARGARAAAAERRQRPARHRWAAGHAP